jgi:hypothetical protein
MSLSRPMSLVRIRRLLVAGGALLAVAGSLGFELMLARSAEHVARTRESCTRYFLLPPMRICGPEVFWINPDGSRVFIGRTSDLRPMPKPEADLARNRSRP